jgi:hypothetical protein
MEDCCPADSSENTEEEEGIKLKLRALRVLHGKILDVLIQAKGIKKLLYLCYENNAK